MNNVFPSNYKITLEPDLETFIFKGCELITFHLKEKIKTINLDCVNIEVQNCFLIDGGERKVLPFKAKENKLVIESEELLDGENEVEIEFEGVLNDKLAGFYRSDYDEDGKTKYLATTQFEAADARQAFPCFDEPAYKATFDVTLVIDKKYTALSNMPVLIEEELESIDNQPPKKSVTFGRTPIMSTYLLYFGVGEFEIKEDQYKNVILRGITTKGKSDYTAFALDCAKKSLEFFETYFDIPYPLPKLDLLAIPDFASGAMENWGAITFRENAVLFYPDKSSLSTKQRIAEVVAHEVAHQWFGNLVTMKWWDDLWLNESFATFMAYKVLDKYWPYWDIWTQYLMTTVFEGMTLDSLKSSHAIKVDVKNVEEMNELFDEIAYDKGGSILRMLERFMGEQAFRNGLRTYMKRFEYNNSEAIDLWKSLDEHSPAEIESLVEKFVTKIGFPYITVAKDSVTQNRFLSDESTDTESLWDIPLVIQYTDGSEKNIVMNKKTIPLSGIEKLQTINGEYGGFFITNYSDEVFKKTCGSFSELTPREKIGFIHDLFYSTYFQKQSFKTFIKFLNGYAKEETDAAVLYYIIQVLDHIDSLKELKEVKILLEYFGKLGIEKVGLEPKDNDSTNDIFLRSASLSTLSQLDDKDVADILMKKFKEYLKSPDSLHPDLKLVTFMNAVWVDVNEYQTMMSLYKETTIQEEKVKLLYALVNSKDPIKIKEALDFCLSPDVRFANVFVAMSAASKNPYAKKILLEWMIANWGEFKKRVGGHGGTLLRRFMKIVIPVCGIGEEEKVKEFIKKNKVKGLEKTFEQVEEELQINEAFSQLLLS